ncbi:ring-cleaving dioxygenase [Alkalibacterium sp. MB6]|uniref:ring-cleaving dioxygenase n=1 Tax=Alkalibacterium sp. MB6 TaxID=2081965 RepID=UPI00137A6E65|nr:ring-cleaving dioxygenase [Alkalibacterium sp. MB6]
MKRTLGIHHITSIVGHPQENAEFYGNVLGLRLIKKTVNFDDPQTYHLYFGNEGGDPGTIITFFPWANARQGRIGGGQVGVTTYAVPVNSFDFWKNHLADKGIHVTETTRFGEDYLQFEDVHGLKLELVEREAGKPNTWSNSGLSPDVAIKGFGGATLYSLNPQGTIQTLTETMGLEKIGEENGLVRLKAIGETANIIDVPTEPVPNGRIGVGIVHHIAWRANDQQDHLEWQSLVSYKGHNVTEVKDRNYFDAIYFKEPGTILFEIATDTPGFAHDESYETMGSELKLPPQYESRREELEQVLPPINLTN